MQKCSNLNHGQGNGNKAVRNMRNTENEYKTMKLLKTFMRSKRFLALQRNKIFQGSLFRYSKQQKGLEK